MPLEEIGELKLAQRRLPRAAIAAAPLRRPRVVAKLGWADPRLLERVDPFQEAREQPRGIAADLVPSQRELVDAVEQDREPVGRAHHLEEGVDPTFKRVIAEELLGKLLPCVDPQLLVGAVEQGLDAVAKPGPSGGILGEDADPVGGNAFQDESDVATCDQLGATGARDPENQSGAATVGDCCFELWRGAGHGSGSEGNGRATTMARMDSVDWLAIARRCASRQLALFAEVTTIGGRTRYEGRGEGGDMTLELDRRCEDIVFEELEVALAAGPSVLAVSEERGELVIGGGEPSIRVVIDPIDGSLNVRRTIPQHSLSFAVADGDSMADIGFGFVHDFGSGHEFAAWRGGGSRFNGKPIEADPPDHGLEVVGVESAEPGWVAPSIAALEGRAYRIRVVGSIAITMSWVAAARLDAMFSARPCRSVDAAASQLIVLEAGGAVDFGGLDPGEAMLDLDSRYRVAAARRAENLDAVLEAQAAGGHDSSRL